MAEVPGNMEAAGSVTGEIDASWFTGDDIVVKEVDGVITFEFGVTEARPRNKEAPSSFTDENGVTMVTEKSWVDYVILHKKDQPLLTQNQGREAMVITKEKVPDSFMEILLQRRPFKKHPPLSDVYSNFLAKYDPELLELSLMDTARWNCCVDLHVDVLRQHEARGFAEIGVDFTGGVKKIFALPSESIRASL